MKKSTLLAVFIAITATNDNRCMEKQEKKLKQLLIVKTDDNYKKLHTILKKNSADGYTTLNHALQYEMLITCIDNNNMKCFALCLEQHKFNPNRYHKGLSLLHYAIQRKNTEALWLLGDANPDLIPHNSVEQTPLDYAMSLKHAESIHVMVNIIKMKINDLILRHQHCGLTKHILKPEFPCYKCIELLNWQLQWHGLHMRPYSPTSDYYSTATDAESDAGSGSSLYADSDSNS